MRIRKLYTYVIIAIFVLFVFSCGNQKSGNQTNDTSLPTDTFKIANTQNDTTRVPQLIVVRDTFKVHRNYKQRVYRDRIIVRRDSSIEYTLVLQPQMLDSIKTQSLMEQTLWTGYVDIRKNDHGNIPEIFYNNNLEYLPYLMLSFSKPEQASRLSLQLYNYYLSLCSTTINDSLLYSCGKNLADWMNNKNAEYLPEINPKNGKVRTKFSIDYPPKFGQGCVPSLIEERDFNLSKVDTLRLRTLFYNDREALSTLENYYRSIKYSKGIAIYYKIMLGYEGNGDLAERFYRVLEPYFDETPQFRIAVREVLLRAALCDHNQRAQELCDSLGFSLCDYKVPVPMSE